MSSFTPPLLAVAHGSRDPRAAATVEALLSEVRARRPERRVGTAYLDHAPPTVGQAVSALDADGIDDVAVLPLLLTAAYHSKTDIPGALTQAQRKHPRMRFRYGDTLGPHPQLTAALERRLIDTGVCVGDPETAVVLAAAGSADDSSNATIAEIARGWHRRGWWGVVPAYASAAAPTPADAVASLRAAGAPRVVVASYFLAPGFFADKVRQAALDAGADVVSDVLGAAPEVAEVVIERYGAASSSSPAWTPASRTA